MGLSVGLDKMMMFTPVIMFVSSLPIFYAGWGGRETIGGSPRDVPLTWEHAGDVARLLQSGAAQAI